MTVPANNAIRATEQCWALCGEGRYDSAGDLMDPAFVHDDRRHGLTNTITGREDTIDNNRVVVEMGFTPMFEPLLVDDDRVALVRATFCDPAGNEVVSLQLLGANDRGLRTYCVSFDEADLDGATREFERRRRSS